MEVGPAQACAVKVESVPDNKPLWSYCVPMSHAGPFVLALFPFRKHSNPNPTLVGRKAYCFLVVARVDVIEGCLLLACVIWAGAELVLGISFCFCDNDCQKHRGTCQGTAFRRESPTLFLELWGDEALSTLASTFLFIKADQEFSVFWGATGELYSLLLMPESHSTDGREWLGVPELDSVIREMLRDKKSCPRGLISYRERALGPCCRSFSRFGKGFPLKDCQDWKYLCEFRIRKLKLMPRRPDFLG
ncbi:hypothetical protein VNO78_35179 [Psophocarpus tetragonolobus]|uniref:Uncharacterized protein n=1 Tax=Psophocarpus tetragonolobus TaxID=3891 RepID=A0AAN9NN24_PSOTE